MDVEAITHLVELVAGTVGLTVASAGAFLVARKYLWSVWRVVATAHRIVNEFGSGAVVDLVALVRQNQLAAETLHIRIQVLEEHQHIGVYVCDPEGRCTWANQYLADAFGLDLGEMKGFGWLRAIGSREREQVQQRWKTALQNGIPYNGEYHVIPCDGSPDFRGGP